MKNISLTTLKSLLPELSQALMGSLLKAITHNDRKRFIFHFEKKKEMFYLFVRLDMPFTRVHLITKYPKGFETAPLPLQALVGMSLESLSLFENDRILHVEFKNVLGSLKLFVSLIPHRGAFLLQNAHAKVLYGDPSLLTKRSSPSTSQVDVDPIASSSLLEECYNILEQEEIFNFRREFQLKNAQKHLKKTLKAIELATEELKESLLSEERCFEAQLLQSNWHQILPRSKETILDDWREDGKKIVLSLNPELSLEQQIKKRFAIVKKLRKRAAYLPIRLEVLEKEKNFFVEEQKLFREAKELTDLAIASPKNEIPQLVKKEHPFREFKSLSGLSIYVGKKDKDNERLTFSFAKGADLWSHADGSKGAHVVLRVSKNKEVDEEAIQDILQLAKYFSGYREECFADVVLTEVKNLHKPKGAPIGLVMMRKRKIISVKRDELRLKRLFSKQDLLL